MEAKTTSSFSSIPCENLILYHGSTIIVEKPAVILGKKTKDFGFGFYVTNRKDQAIRWATRYQKKGICNIYKYREDTSFNILKFNGLTEEWLDFIAACRSGVKHNYDIVEGPMADDTVFNYVQDFLAGTISRAAFWELVKFKHPTHQICFCSQKAIDACLTFLSGDVCYGKRL